MRIIRAALLVGFLAALGWGQRDKTPAPSTWILALNPEKNAITISHPALGVVMQSARLTREGAFGAEPCRNLDGGAFCGKPADVAERLPQGGAYDGRE